MRFAWCDSHFWHVRILFAIRTAGHNYCLNEFSSIFRSSILVTCLAPPFLLMHRVLTGFGQELQFVMVVPLVHIEVYNQKVTEVDGRHVFT